MTNKTFWVFEAQTPKIRTKYESWLGYIFIIAY